MARFSGEAVELPARVTVGQMAFAHTVVGGLCDASCCFKSLVEVGSEPPRL